MYILKKRIAKSKLTLSTDHIIMKPIVNYLFLFTNDEGKNKVKATNELPKEIVDKLLKLANPTVYSKSKDTLKKDVHKWFYHEGAMLKMKTLEFYDCLHYPTVFFDLTV
jgi:hypothetical protein